MRRENNRRKSKLEVAGLTAAFTLATAFVAMTVHELREIRKLTDEAEESADEDEATEGSAK